MPLSRKITGVAGSIWATRSSSTAESAPKEDTTATKRTFAKKKGVDVAADLGIHFPGGNCWGANFLDADNDGDLDLYVCSSIPVPKEVSSAFYENIEGSQFISPVVEGFAKDNNKSGCVETFPKLASAITELLELMKAD